MMGWIPAFSRLLSPAEPPVTVEEKRRRGLPRAELEADRMVLGGPKVLPQWRKAKLRHGRNLRKYMQHGDTANTAKYMGTVLDQACISAVAAVSVVPPC